MIAFRLFSGIVALIFALVMALTLNLDLLTVIASIAFLVAIDQWAQNIFAMMIMKQLAAYAEEKKNDSDVK